MVQQGGKEMTFTNDKRYVEACENFDYIQALEIFLKENKLREIDLL
jgi:hypothetical protein